MATSSVNPTVDPVDFSIRIPSINVLRITLSRTPRAASVASRSGAGQEIGSNRLSRLFICRLLREHHGEYPPGPGDAFFVGWIRGLDFESVLHAPQQGRQLKGNIGPQLQRRIWVCTDAVQD